MTTSPQLRLPGQAAAPDGPVDLMNMYVMHHAFRRDLARFRWAVRVTDVADRRRWRALQERWRLFATVLHHHHAAEDAGLWPLLLARAEDAGENDARRVLAAMQDEHADIDPVLGCVGAGLALLADQPDDGALLALRRAVDDASRLLEGHLGHEERAAMPLVQGHLSESDWQAVERDHFRPAYPVRELLAVVPWAMLGLPREVRERAFRSAGFPLKVLWWLTRGSFSRREKAAFGSAAPWVADTTTPIAVVGATGTVGRLVLEELVAAHADVRVLVRRARPRDAFPPGVRQVVADLHDEAALHDALAGTRAALYVSPHDADEEHLAAAFLRAARASGTRIVFAGVHVAAGNPLGWLRLQVTAALLPTYRAKLRIGQRIAATSPSPVIFSASNFFQNDEIFEDDIRGGVYPLPMRRVNRVDVRDLAELCARALLEPAFPAGEHTVAGPESLSGEESARIWAAALGREVAYVGDDEAVWIPLFRQRLQGRKLEDLIRTSRFLARHPVALPRAAAATARLLGREPHDYRAYVTSRAGSATTKAPQ